MTEDMVLVDHRPLSFGTVARDEYIESFPPIWEQSPDVRWTLVRDLEVAEHVVLFSRWLHGTTTFGGEFDTVNCCIAIERDGLIARIEDLGTEEHARARFAGLGEATATLEQQVLPGEAADGPAWAAVVAHVAALNSRDLDALRSSVTDDVMIIDHRPAGWGVTSVDGLVGVHTALYERSDDVRWSVLEAFRVSDDMICVPMQALGTTVHGELELSLVAVIGVRDGLMTYMEVFAADESAAAIARFDELQAHAAS